jgi:hypothetical protein
MKHHLLIFSEVPGAYLDYSNASSIQFSASMNACLIIAIDKAVLDFSRF